MHAAHAAGHVSSRRPFHGARALVGIEDAGVYLFIDFGDVIRSHAHFSRIRQGALKSAHGGAL